MTALQQSMPMKHPWADPEIATLRELVRPNAPLASLYLGGHREGAVDAAEDLDLRARALLDELARQGADTETVAAIQSHINGLGLWHAEHVVLASGGAVRFARDLPGAARLDEARFGAPAVVAPVLGWLASHPPYVVVAADRAGGDITSVHGGAGTSRTETIVGPDDEIQHYAPRGWAQPRYQRRAEDSWRHNAGAVADAVLQAAADVHARLVLIAGDIRAVQFVRDRLGEQDAGLTLRPLPGGRSADGSQSTRRSAITEVVGEVVAEQTTVLLSRLREQSGPVGLATEGAQETFTALADGRVGTLLIVADGRERQAWFSDRIPCSLDHPGPDVAATRGRLIDIAVRAALLSNADVWVVPDGHPQAPGEGIGSLCRYRA